MSRLAASIASKGLLGDSVTTAVVSTRLSTRSEVAATVVEVVDVDDVAVLGLSPYRKLSKRAFECSKKLTAGDPIGL